MSLNPDHVRLAGLQRSSIGRLNDTVGQDVTVEAGAAR